MSKHFKEQKGSKDLAYYVTMFKLEGHTTWRCHMSQNQQGFELEQKNWPPKVKITEKNVLRIDRITGTIQPLT